MGLAAIIDSSSKLFLGYTDDADNFVPESNTQLIEINQSILDQLLVDASTEAIIWNNEEWIISNRLEDVKNRKIKKAKEYCLAIDKFYFEEEEYRISLQALRNLWIDNEIRKKDIELNTTECFDFIFDEFDELGQLSNLGVELIEQIVVKVRCYKRKIKSRLNQHIENIRSINDIEILMSYQFNTDYPAIPSISQ